MPKGKTDFRMPKRKKIQLDDVVSWVKNKNLPADIEEQLIQQLKEMPDGCYPQFARNIGVHVANIQKRKAEEGQSKTAPDEASNG